MDVLNPPTFSFESHFPPHRPEDPLLSAAHHRRIELQSPQDLLYLRNNILRAAKERIEVHLPLASTSASSSGAHAETGGSRTIGTGGREEEEGEDSLRKGVEGHVDAWITALLEAAKRNVSVNGIDGEEGTLWPAAASTTLPPTSASTTTSDGTAVTLGAGEEYEAYDTRLAARIAALHAQIEALNLELADTRRNAAGKAAGDFKRAWGRQEGEMEGMLSVGGADGVDDGEKEEEGGFRREDLGLWSVERQEDVKATWEEAMGRLKGLDEALRQTGERAGRARGVVAVLEGRGV